MRDNRTRAREYTLHTEGGNDEKNFNLKFNQDLCSFSENALNAIRPAKTCSFQIQTHTHTPTEGIWCENFILSAKCAEEKIRYDSTKLCHNTIITVKKIPGNYPAKPISQSDKFIGLSPSLSSPFSCSLSLGSFHKGACRLRQFLCQCFPISLNGVIAASFIESLSSEHLQRIKCEKLFELLRFLIITGCNL